MSVVIIICSLPFILRLVLYFYHLIMVNKFLKEEVEFNGIADEKNIIILIPVLREQNVIINTIKHFLKMKLHNINLHLIIAGTKRERKNIEISTVDIVQEWINECGQDLPDNIHVDYCEADDEVGDRATQLNFAINYAFNKMKISRIDCIGVYDADSLPSESTLQEVMYNFSAEADLCACQQPVHFSMAANKMAINKENPILIANALYQSTWTAISELPMWLKYYKHDGKKLSKRHLYLIGHGEFLTQSIYDEFHFPEYEVTDGIQLGYRLGMSNKKVKPLHEFCNDDVPHKVSALIKQHMRWFGGCMNFKSSYMWCRDQFKTNAVIQVIDGLWSQARWAWTVWIYLLLILFWDLFQRQ